MRKLSSLCGILTVVGLLAGCAADESSPNWRKNVPGDEPGQAEQASTTTIQGTISGDPNGNSAVGLAGKDAPSTATTAVVSKLGDNGTLTPVGTAPVQDGKFKLPVPNDGSAAGILILQVKNIAGAVIGSTVLNGIPAFFRGYFIDAPIDVVTSFKTEILMTIARKGVPGVQNFLNIINTFIDSENAGNLVVLAAFAIDFNNIFGAVAGAVVATQQVIQTVLNKAGIPVDFSKITNAELKAISGVQDLVSSADAKFATKVTNLIAALEEATAKAAAPVDKAIYNAVIAGSAMFHSSVQSSKVGQTLAAQQGAEKSSFSLSKTMFKLESQFALDAITKKFGQAGVAQDVIDALTKAGTAFATQIDQAKSLEDLDAARAAFKDALLGKQESSGGGGILKLIATVVANVEAAITNVKNKMAPLEQSLSIALGSHQLTDSAASDAISKFDGDAKDLATQLQGVTDPTKAEALAEALKMTAKVFTP